MMASYVNDSWGTLVAVCVVLLVFIVLGEIISRRIGRDEDDTDPEG